MKTQHSAGGVVVYKQKDNKWLVLLIKDMNGNWTFPKGLIEANENISEAARREIAEETKIIDIQFVKKLKSINYIYRNHTGDLVKKTVDYFLFKTDRLYKPMPQPEEGITEATWFDYDKAVIKIGYQGTNQKVLTETGKYLKNL